MRIDAVHEVSLDSRFRGNDNKDEYGLSFPT